MHQPCATRPSVSSVRFADGHMNALPSPLRGNIAWHPSIKVVRPSIARAACTKRSAGGAAIEGRFSWNLRWPDPATVGRAGRS